jgi:hypothetical protein
MISAREAHAQSLSDQVRACAAESASGRRLECYDHMASGLNKSGAAPGASGTSAKPTAAASDPSPEAAKSAASGFGVSGTPLGRKKESAEPKQIEAVVTKIGQRGRGELVISLDNGQVWAQLAALSYFPLKPGDTIQIASGALGSYVLSTPAKRATKVTRLE